MPSKRFITGSTAYGQNMTTATTGKYLLEIASQHLIHHSVSFAITTLLPLL
jgi:hypothetical protein